MNEKAPEYGGRDVLSRYAKMRTVCAAHLAGRTGLDIYTSGGGVLSESSEPEGLLMQRMLMRPGLPKAAIYMETNANNTWDCCGIACAMIEFKSLGYSNLEEA